MGKKAISIDARNYTQNLTIGQFLCKERQSDIFNISVELWAHFYCHVKQPLLENELKITVNTDLEVQQSLTCIDDVFYPGQKSTNKEISSSTTQRPTTPTEFTTKLCVKCDDGSQFGSTCCAPNACLYRSSPPFHFECN